MTFDWSLANLTGLAAGVLILALGTFVLVARPRASLNRAFFLLAFVDGVSTLLFTLRDVVDDPRLAYFFHASYYYFFVAFVLLLLGFGLLFPRPLGGRARRPLVIAGLAALGGFTILAYVLDHGLFFSPIVRGDALAVERTTWGLLVSTAYLVATAAVIAKLARDVQAGETVDLERQASFVLGGMLLAYATFSATSLARSLLVTPETTFLSPRWDMRVLTWASVLVAGAAVGAAVHLWRARDTLDPRTRRFLVAAFAATTVLVALSVAFPSGGFLLASRIGLLAYPLLLAYAIVGFEAFEINAQVRRAAVVTVAGAAITAVFVVAEALVEDVFQRYLDFLPSDFAIGVLSALVAAAFVIPIVRASSFAVNRFFPHLMTQVDHVKHLALYRLTLEGALEDGMLDARESRTLTVIRDGLGITRAEHEKIEAEVRAQSALRAARPSRAGGDASADALREV